MKKDTYPFPFFIIILAILAGSSLPLSAQQAVIRFEHIGIEQGLPQGQIIDVMEDSQGFIWCSTMTGLVKYDGYRFVQYLHDAADTTSLSHVTPGRIFEDRAGALWIGSHSGLNRWDRSTNRFTRFVDAPGLADHLLSSAVETVFEDNRGRLWVSTFHGLLTYQDGVFKQITGWTGYCASIVEDQNGLIWSIAPEGLLSIDPTRDAMRNFPTPDFQIIKIYLDRKQDFWLGTNIGLFQWDPTDERFHRIILKGTDREQAIRDIIQDKKGYLWLATNNDNGIFRFHPQTGELQHFTHDPANSFSLGSNHVRTFWIDRLNQLWIGTYTGLNKVDLNEPRFTLLQQRPGLGHPENHILRVHADRRGGLWFSTYDQRLFHSRKPGLEATEIHLPESIRNLFEAPFQAFFNASDQHIGFNINQMDIVLYPISGNAADIRRLRAGENAELLHAKEFMALDREDSTKLWLASSGGLCKLDLQTLSFQTFSPRHDITALKNEHIYTALQVDEQFIYVQLEANFNGRLARFHKKEERYEPIDIRTAFPDQKSTLHIRQLAATADGTLWIAAAEGLGIVYPDADTLSLLRVTDGLIDDNLMGIAVDRQGNIWLKSLHHISSYHPRRGTFRHFKVGADMQEFNAVGLTQGPDGRLFFHGNNGIYSCLPEAITLDTSLPNVILTDFSVLNESRHFGTSPEWIKEITLGYRDHVFSFEFAGLNARNAKDFQYRYQLENFDADWRPAGPERRATYTNLNAGRYTFRVIAANADGMWNEANSLRVKLRILPPPWLSWWAYGLYLVLIGSVLYAGYHFQLKRKLEKAEAARILELDQFKTRLYTNLTHEFRTPLTVILGMADKLLTRPQDWWEKGLSMIRRNGQQLLELVNQLLDLAKLEAGRMELNVVQQDILPFLKYTIEAYHSLAQTKNIRLHTIVEAEAIVMDYDPEKIKIIVANLVTNAIKYTEAGGKVLFKVSNVNDQLYLKITDTGIGIPQDQLPYIFDRFYQVDASQTRPGEGTGIGLALTLELVKLLEGTIEVESRVGGGSTFIVKLPITHQAPLDHPPVAVVERKQVVAEPVVRPNDKRHLPIGLIIEDNVDVVQYILSCLEAQYRFEVAYNGKEGLQKAIDIVPDFIISDVMMPELDGFAVCRILKQDKRTSHIPIVLLTARADQSSRITGLTFGADAYLVKPFNESELLVEIGKLLELRHKLKEYYRSLAGSQYSASNNHPHYPLEGGFLREVQDLITEHLQDEELNVNRLCKLLLISRTQLHRKIKALTGLSTTRFINKVRLGEAEKLLINTDLSIKEVAYQVGFSSPDYFRRLFYEAYQCAPSRFRRERLSKT